MAHKVFISFSAKDKSIANSLKRQLADAGAEVSLAEPFVERKGSNIKLAIADAIKQSDEVIAIVSKNSVESPWLSFEVGIAVGLGKKLVPVVVGIEPNKLSPVMRSLQSVKLDGFGHYVTQMSGRLHGRTR